MEKIKIENNNSTMILTTSEEGVLDIVVLSDNIHGGLIALKPMSKETLNSLLKQDLFPWATKSGQIVIFQKGSLCHSSSGLCIHMSEIQEIKDLLVQKVLIEFK